MATKRTITFETILVELDHRIATIILNRPEKLNAVNPQMSKDLAKALQEIDDDEESRVVIVKGAGRAFCAGADITPPPGEKTQRSQAPQWQYLLRAQKFIWPQLWYFRKPTISQIHGYCIGAGCSAGLLCDLVVAADDALIGQPEARAQGTTADQGMWPLTIGPRLTKWLVFTGDMVTGKEAEAMGMINKAVPTAQLEKYVQWLANRISQMDSGMLTYHKATINAWYDIMGLPAMLQAGQLYWTLDQFAEAGEEFKTIAKEHGLRAALQWRDGPFGGPLRQGMPLPRGPLSQP